MTPQDFVAKWRASPKDERRIPIATSSTSARCSASPDPASAADPGFTFEKGAAKASGGSGWADVWRRGGFGWEYKGYRARPRRRLLPAPDTRPRWRTRRS